MEQLLKDTFAKVNTRVTRYGEETFGIRIVADLDSMRERWVTLFLNELVALCGGANVTVNDGYYVTKDGNIDAEVSVLLQTDCVNPDEIFFMLAPKISRYMLEEDQETVYLQIGLHVALATREQVQYAHKTMKSVKEIMA